MAFILYICERKYTAKVMAVLLIGDVFVFMYSLSYTGLFISLLMIGIFTYFMYRNKITVMEKIIIMCVLPGCIVISTIIPYFIDSEGLLYAICNAALNNRIWAIKVFFHYYDVTLWGQRIILENFSLDNSFIYALAWYGVLFLLVISVFYWILIKECLKQERRKELAIILTFLLAGITEQFLFNASVKNITFIFMGNVLYQYVGQAGKKLRLASKWNRTFQISVDKAICYMHSTNKNSWRKNMVLYAILNILALLTFCLTIKYPYSRVYVNERLCDCDGTLVNAYQIENTDDTLVIGDISGEDMFYEFTSANSYLIAIMEMRYKISLSIYAAAILMIIIGGIRWLGNRLIFERRGEPENG